MEGFDSIHIVIQGSNYIGRVLIVSIQSSRDPITLGGFCWHPYSHPEIQLLWEGFDSIHIVIQGSNYLGRVLIASI